MKRVPRNLRVREKRESQLTCETYAIHVRCRNCGWTGDTDVPKGTPVELHQPLDHRFPCQHCGCVQLRRIEKRAFQAQPAVDRTLEEIRALLQQEPTRAILPPPASDDVAEPLGVIELKPAPNMSQSELDVAIDVFRRQAMRRSAEEFNSSVSSPPSWLEGGESP